MSDPTILACPFCGHAGLAFEQGSTFRWLAYSCVGCGMGSETRIQTMGEGTPEQWREQAERDAVDAWNRRAAASALPVPAEPTDEQLIALVLETGAKGLLPTQRQAVIERGREAFARLVAAGYGAPHPSEVEKNAARYQQALQDIAAMTYDFWSNGARAKEIADAALAPHKEDGK